MPKITHIFKTYFPETNGGLEEAIRQYGSHAAQNGFEVEVVSVGSGNYTVASPDNITTRFYRKSFDRLSNPFSMAFARSFKRICTHTDILHFHFPWPTAELLTLCHSMETPALVTFHCDIHKAKPLKQLYLPFVTRFLGKMDAVCISSKRLFNTTPYLAQFTEKIHEVSYFVNKSRFAGLGEPDREIMAFAGKHKNYVLFAGMLRWYKGLDVLLDAAKQMKHPVVIVGKGELFDRLHARIQNEKINTVHLMGFQSDANLKFLIENCGLVVLPSTAPAEAFGQILLEGLYFSKPLVSTELGTGTSIVNRHNHTGVVVPPGCPVALARAMNTILTDERLAHRFSTNAFHHYLDNFTARAQGDKYLRIYRSLL
jgi:rhamnosyl/mannosyltransferase